MGLKLSRMDYECDLCGKEWTSTRQPAMELPTASLDTSIFGVTVSTFMGVTIPWR